jgi:WD40 repeat protein
MVWDTKTGDRMHTLRDKTETMMAIQDLIIDPADSSDSEIILMSSSSDPHIRRWRIGVDSASEIVDPAESAEPADVRAGRPTILEHETSVYKLLFVGEAEDIDLWTASADGTAKCLSRAKNWSAEETYKHGDYVRAVVVTSDWVVTAGRDEDVKVWDKSTGELRHTYEGHYEEITGLVLIEEERRVVSVGIDGTLRTWSLTNAELNNAIEQKEEKERGVTKEEKFQPPHSLLTAEEESELAELMDSDEEQHTDCHE